MRPIFPLGGLRRGSALLVILMACLVAFCQGARQLSIGAVFTDKLTTSFFGFRRGAILHNVANNGTDSVQFVGFEKYVTEANSFELGQKLCDLFTNGILLIGADIEPPLISTALSYSSTFHIPIIITSLSKRDMGLNTTGSRDYLVSMMPSLVPVMVDLIQFHQWKRFAYIYDGDTGLLRLHALVERLSLSSYDVAFRKINNRTSIIQSLREFRDTKRQQIICDTSYRNTKLLMEQIPLLGMVTASYHYIFMDLDIDKINMEKFQYGGMNVTGFNILNETSTSFILMKRAWDFIKKQNTSSISRKQKFLTHRSALMMDLVDVMDKTVKILKQEKKLDQFDNRGQRSCDDDPFRPWEFDKNVLRFLKRVSFAGATGPISFNNFGERSNYIVNILSLFYDGMQKIGIWDAKMRNHLKFDNGAYVNGNGPGNSKNKTYLVTSVIEPPYLMLKEPRHLYFGNDRYQGYAIDLLEEIVKKTRFKYKIQLAHDKAYGIPINGTWNGMVGELVDGKADIAVAPLTITSDRERVIDFTKPFMSLGISIMIKKPQTTKPDVFSFMHPLSYEIWMCIVLAYAGVSVVLFLVSRFSPKEWYPIEYTRVPTDDQPNSAGQLIDKTTNDFGITNSLWFSFGALMQQGCDISPRSLSGRIVGGVWWFFTLIIISSYTANLAAFLTVERMVTNIKSAQDLVRSKDVSYGMLKQGSTLEFFKVNKVRGAIENPLYMDMWTYMNNSERSVLMTSNEQGVERVRHMNGKFAFLIESTINEYFSQQKPCDTMKVGQNLDSKSYGIGVSRNLTKFSDDLTLAILQLREEGVLDALQKRWWFDKGECHLANSDASSNALSLSNVAGVFYILVGGLSMALFSAIIEFYWKSRSQSRKQKTSLAAAMRAKVRLSVTGENADLASQLHPKGNASAASTETETTPVDKPKDSSPEGNHTEV